VLVDRAHIYVRAGDGGNGSKSFRREKFAPKGGPDGGDGGRGGDVRLRVRQSLTSLLPFQFNQKFEAERGQSGSRQQKHGKSGRHLYLDVPPGTVVWDDDTGELLADLTEPGEEVVAAKGGRGGLGNVHFKSSVHQAPRIAELGEPGEERNLRMELRIIADVGLVGLPNAGKSTLLAASSRARPKIADYPFTTLEPNLGAVEVGGRGGQTFVIADIPGLIEGAASGAGLGHEFLRHITRTKVLIHVLDASGGLEGRDPLEDFQTINAELELFDPDLREKAMLVALNKVDLVEARDNLPRLRGTLEQAGFTVYPVSAATGEGVQRLLEDVAAALREVHELDTSKKAEKPQERRRYTLAQQDERAWQVTRRSAHHFDVTGIGIERFTKMTDFANDEAVDRFQRVLSTSGISEELERLGIEEGDTVHLAGHEFAWGDEYAFTNAEEGSSRRKTRRERRQPSAELFYPEDDLVVEDA
jgi:GTP-binding protein